MIGNKEVRAIIRDKSNDGEGCSAFYFRLNKKQGVKFWLTNYERNVNMRSQQELAKLGLAPAVYRKINHNFYSPWMGYNEKHYGIVVEHVPYVFDVDYDDNSYHKIRNIHWDDSDECAAINELLEQYGYYHDDLHESNVGMIGNRLVVLDMGGLHRDNELICAIDYDWD